MESRLQKVRERDRLGYSIVKDKNNTPYLASNNALYNKLTGKEILGSSGEDFEEVRWKLGIIIISSLVIGIISTVGYQNYEDSTIDTSENQTIREIMVAILSISWFLFITFVFLLFSQGRLMYILFFITVTALALISNSIIENQMIKGDSRNRKIHEILISMAILAIVTACILSYYWVISKGESEILELKSQEKLRKQNELFAKEIAEQKKLVKEATKAEYEEKLKSKDEIGAKAIDLLLEKGAKSFNQPPKGNKKKEDKE